MNLDSVWFDAIARGAKTIEGRLAKGKFLNFYPGQQIIVTNTSTGQQMMVTIKQISRFANFEQMISCYGLNQVLPGVNCLAEGLAIYRRYYSASDEETYGVLAISLSV